MTGETYYLTKFTAFGVSLTVEKNTKVKSYRFISDEELAEAVWLAAETLLVYGSNYNGLSRPDGCNRVALDGSSCG
ncbi:MAG: hypothetical protein H7146_11870 [Burkholderiaceae bacterium]|nr:hypothetical protein [Microbacteriaceae bacterium]